MAGRRFFRNWPSLRSHSFYFRIVTAILGLLILTAFSIISYNYDQNREMALELGDDLMNQINKIVIEKTSHYFLPAATLTETSARLTAIGALSPSNKNQMELFTLGVLKSYPQVSMFFFGDERGNYIRAWRLADGTMETRYIETGSSPPTNTFRYWNAEFKLMRTEKSSRIDYDPRVRPWYRGAKETRTTFWTALYILARNRKPAITLAHPLEDHQGHLVGVWGVDLELEGMSTFLRNLKIGGNGMAFIINEKHELVAFPGTLSITYGKDGMMRPVRLEELGVAPITAAFGEYLRDGKGKLAITIVRKRYLASFTELSPPFPASWILGVVVPEDDFIGGAKLIIQETLFICLAILLMAILLAILIGRSISQPIKLLAKETRKIKDFHLEGKLEIRSHIKEIQSMTNAISAMKTGLKAFRKYVPAELVRQLIDTGEETCLGGHKRQLTVFFSDIAGFTTLAEQVGAEELMVHLSEYFDELTRILNQRKGTVDKYIGDGIMAFWGAPVPDEEHARHACLAALECQERLEELNRKWQGEGKNRLTTRIGISTGETVVGNVGSSDRINYTVMGDNVNLASRLEGVNKVFGTKIIVSRETKETVAESFWFRPLAIVAVKGRSEGTTIYELVGRKTLGQPGGARAELCDGFCQGFKAYLARDWERAYKIFADLSGKFPGDSPTIFYLARCRACRVSPPGADWKGVERLEVK